MNDEKVEVAEVPEVPQDVYFSTGNIRFPGSVEIQGSVNAGFTIEVRDNLKVGGSVAGAHLAGAGDTAIAAGFLGDSEGRAGALLAGGDIQVKNVQGATSRPAATSPLAATSCGPTSASWVRSRSPVAAG